jgi:hypothetical protein
MEKLMLEEALAVGSQGDRYEYFRGPTHIKHSPFIVG